MRKVQRAECNTRSATDQWSMSETLETPEAHSSILKGYIHQLADFPLMVHTYEEDSPRRLKESGTSVHIDATGAVSHQVGNTRPYLHSIIASPTERASYPVAHMLTEINISTKQWVEVYRGIINTVCRSTSDSMCHTCPAPQPHTARSISTTRRRPYETSWSPSLDQTCCAESALRGQQCNGNKYKTPNHVERPTLDQGKLPRYDPNKKVTV